MVAKAKEILGKGNAFIIADLEPKDLIAVADLPEAKNSIIVNIRSTRKLFARSCAASMCSTSFPTRRCAPMRLGNTSSGRNGRAGS